MRDRLPVVLGLVFGLAAAASAEPPKAVDKLARGKYLVEQAGQCQDATPPTAKRASP